MCSTRGRFTCNNCDEGLDRHGYPTVTYYCSHHAQWRGDDRDHDDDCGRANDRKHLYRAGRLLQGIFFEFCEANFFLDVHQAWVEDGKLRFKGEPVGAGKPPFYPYPNELIPGDFKNALITWNRCVDAVGYMREIMNKAVKGINSSANVCHDVD